MATQPPKQPLTTKQKVVGGASAAAVALALAVAGIKPDEGKRNYTYLDIAKIPTDCYGHVDYASKVGAYHSDAECDALLSTDVNAKLEAVQACVPELRNRPYQLAAATRLTFNIGQGNFCQSSSARNFRAGNFKAGCAGFMGWDGVIGKFPVQGAVSVKKLADGRYFSVIKGLKDRRTREAAQCSIGL